MGFGAKNQRILGHEIRCVARWEDTTYWGAVAVGYRFPIAEIEALMCAVGADAESCPDAIPVDGRQLFFIEYGAFAVSVTGCFNRNMGV